MTPIHAKEYRVEASDDGATSGGALLEGGEGTGLLVPPLADALAAEPDVLAMLNNNKGGAGPDKD